MKSYFVLILNIVLVSACFSHGYYPLQIGNRWDYGYLDQTPTGSHFVYQRSVRVTGDTVMPNAERYSVLSDGSYLRQQGDTVYGYTAVRGEFVALDFSLQYGDTIKAYYPDDTLTTIVYRDTSTVFGKTRTVWTFYTRSSATSFYSFTDIADSIGYIYGEWEPGENEYCLGAIIGGVQYGTIAAVASLHDVLPTRFSLKQNYPNPFNPATEIVYSLPVRAYVTLTVYDLLGRVVSVMPDGLQSPGEHHIHFDGSKLTSGVFFYRLQAGQLSRTRSMVLLK
jgi:hypothetical protein